MTKLNIKPGVPKIQMSHSMPAQIHYLAKNSASAYGMSLREFMNLAIYEKVLKVYKHDDSGMLAQLAKLYEETTGNVFDTALLVGNDEKAITQEAAKVVKNDDETSEKIKAITG